MNPVRRVAVVTGAGQGLGRAIALRLAQDGFDIALNDLASNLPALESVGEEIRGKGRKAITVTGDVGQEDAVQNLVDRTVAELGELYVMVANAGIAEGTSKTVVDMSIDLWNRHLSVNLTGVFLCYRAAARQMLKQGHGGRIIGASSVLGKRGGAGVSAYSTTKFGVRGLTQAMATELAKDGITVNAYAPGYIDTALVKNVDTRVNAIQGQPVGTWTQGVLSTVPMGRLGTAENVAGLVSYMVSDEADFMTGQSVSLNGGLFYD